MRFRIYRYDPDKDARPYMQDYDVQAEPSDSMLLDMLIRIKAQDDSLSLRRSCRGHIDRGPQPCSPRKRTSF